MPIPDYQSIMLPILKFTGDGKEHSLRETIEFLAQQFGLSDEERKELLPSGRQATFDNRVGWARTYMKKAGLLDYTGRGLFCITERGKEVLSKNPTEINAKFLKKFPEFVEFQKIKKTDGEGQTPSIEPTITPEESLEASFQELKESLASDLLQTIKGCSSEFFERLVVDVLIKIGYGGSRREAGQAMGRSGDGGIDGIIKEDKLGLDIIYIQAKRWENTVGRPEIQKFAGALQGQRARKGIFITTSNFSKEALDYVQNIDSKIILIDGQRLAELMIENNVGVSPVSTYEVKKIDSDYFTDS
ncbi:Mrr restriction system protein [uncultured Desulfatiglans sp.]|nr:Mrr restriction system protein [uncultured Desulfatiglans sp.]